jgi:hypothetical protein
VHVKAMLVLVETVRVIVSPVRVPLEALRLLHRREIVRVIIKAMRVPIEILGEPNEAARVYNTHCLYNTLTAVRKF